MKLNIELASAIYKSFKSTLATFLGYINVTPLVTALKLGHLAAKQKLALNRKIAIYSSGRAPRDGKL